MLYCRLELTLTLTTHPSRRCPPCRSFTPVAGDFYKALSASDPSALEVIFVSSDEDAEAFDHYYGEQPWTAIPFTDPVREALGSKFGVRGIPSFIVLNPATGEIVDREGRGTVTANKDSPVGALAKWVK